VDRVSSFYLCALDLACTATNLQNRARTGKAGRFTAAGSITSKVSGGTCADAARSDLVQMGKLFDAGLGFALLIWSTTRGILSLLIKSVAELANGRAVGFLLSLGFGWLVYDQICKANSAKQTRVDDRPVW